MEGLFILMGLTLIAGSILGIVSYQKVTAQSKEIQKLRARLEQLAAGLQPPSPAPSPDSTPEPAPVPVQAPAQQPTTKLANSEPETQPTPAEASTSPQKVSSTPPPRKQPERPKGPSRFDELVQSIRANWMTWLGGISLALAGIFLVIYSIEQGLLGPTARIALGIVSGLALLIAAEFLRRRQQHATEIFAALAAAGSITLFASIYAGQQLYDLISPGVAFPALALVGLATATLAILHGPMLAALGLLGAFTVPALVSTGSNNALAALLYILVITGSGAALTRFVYRPWLWWGLAAGTLCWWLITLDMHQADNFRGAYLALSMYLLVALPKFDWWLRDVFQFDKESYRPTAWLRITEPLERGIPRFGLLCIGALTLTAIGNDDNHLSLWLPLLGLAALATRRKEHLNFMPWLITLNALASLLFLALDTYEDRLRLIPAAVDELQSTFTLLLCLSLVSILVGVWYQGQDRFKAVWSSYATLPSVLAIAVGYLLADVYAGQWALGALILGTIYIAGASYLTARLSERPDAAQNPATVVWLYFSGHFAWSTAAAIALTPDTLTLVFAAQLVTTAWLMRRFRVDLTWIIKLLATIVIVRLTFNPWLITYPVDQHWTLWAYGGSAILAALGWWTLKPDQSTHAVGARKWLEGAALHITVLAVWTELRWWLHDGDVFIDKMTALETGLYVLLFGAISIVYYRRAALSESLAWLYKTFSAVTTLISLLSYFLILSATLVSLKWVWGDISPRPIFNLGLLLYGAPVVVAYIIYRYGHSLFQQGAKWVASAGAFIFINLQIRHLWNNTFDFSERISQGEMVTLSIAWLAMAIGALLYASQRRSQSMTVYRLGMALLAVTIAKIFLVDMSDLTGLVRVLSFLGLGFALLGLSYLHRRIDPSSS